MPPKPPINKSKRPAPSKKTSDGARGGGGGAGKPVSLSGMNLYFTAASFLDHLEKNQTSLKAHLTSLSLPPKDSPRLLALVVQTLKYKPTILELLEKLPLTKDEKQVIYKKGKNLALVLVHDILFAAKPGIQTGSGPIKDAILGHQTRLKSELVRLKIKQGLSSNKQLQVGGGLGENIPRYARINTNLTTPSDLIAYLQSPSGGSFILLTPTPVTPSSPSPYPKTIDLPLKSFHLSPDLPNILIFPLSSTSFITNNAAYVDGRIILQDLASCMPALVLLGDPEKRAAEGGGEGGEGVVDGWDGVGEVIDATSAPGNKTTHLSMLMGNKGKVHAFELSPHRFQILKKMVKTAGCKNVSLGPGEEGTRRDFLETDPTSEEWSRVKYIMLDPSCSGSGIVNRLDHLMDDPEEENDDSKQDRLDKLATFQLGMIRHAMKFPTPHRLTYSTCSTHPTEDEHVVLRALQSPEAIAGGWTLAPRSSVLPNWPRRGRLDEFTKAETKWGKGGGGKAVERRTEWSEGVVRCDAAEGDACNGFFVSCFVRAPQSHGVTSLASEYKQQKKNAAKKQKQQQKKQSSSTEAVAAAAASSSATSSIGNNLPDDIPAAPLSATETTPVAAPSADPAGKGKKRKAADEDAPAVAPAPTSVTPAAAVAAVDGDGDAEMTTKTPAFDLGGEVTKKKNKKRPKKKKKTAAAGDGALDAEGGDDDAE